MDKQHCNRSVIDVDEVLQHMPHFETFCSVEKLHGLVERLRKDPRFEVKRAGSSVNGSPIHHVRFGSGSVKVMLLAFPHPMEPIGGLTVFSLITLLQQKNRTLLDADVEWNFVTCADPDGALLNEVWTQQFTIDNFLQNYYMPTPRDQASTSFPITHKKLVWNQPSKEAKVVMELFHQIKPEFYFTLHNIRAGGLFIGLSHDIDHKYHAEIHDLMRSLNFPIQKRAAHKEVCTPFGHGISELPFLRKMYDYIEQFTPAPEDNRILRDGAFEWDYLAEINPSALSMFAEMGCVGHPYDGSGKVTLFNLRRLKLQVDANTKYLASVLLDEWNKVRQDLDPASPFYRVTTGYILPSTSKIAEGGWPLSRYPTAEILSDPLNDRMATEGEVFNVCVMDGGLYYIQYASPFLRLVKTSRQTPAVQEAVERTEQAFNDARARIGRYIDFGAFERFDCNLLAKVQTGSGLIVLNSILATSSG